MITSNVYQRVFYLRHKESMGTCFTVEVDSKQYLVTAKHIVKDFSETYLELFRDNMWKQISVLLVGHCEGEVDISVFAPCVQISSSHPLMANANGMCFGQDMYFLGYPFGLQFDVGELNGGCPLPFVKKCILSGRGAHKSLLYLDGHNNPGFSGGPVVFEVPGRISPQKSGEIIKLEYQIAAVISGYRIEHKKVVFGNNITALRAEENSGLIRAYMINEAIDLIKKNPIGLKLDS